ncbi:hypothetical protein V6N11_050245 [Hibiscus sabdariffa]|uniref:Uncharacterized protein n=1 Tax=Hibiscus sabdariffa TaxID=183260 RepID=A0ABR2T9L3_9ROSI
MKLEPLQTLVAGFLHGRLRGPPCHLHTAWFCMKLELLQPLAAGFLHGRLHETGTAAAARYANERNGLDVEDDVWNAVVARLGFGNTQPVWGYWTTDRATGTQLYSL